MKTRTLFLTLFIVTALLSNSCSNKKTTTDNIENNNAPTSVVLMIGDGMSVPQVYAAMLTIENTSFERFPVTGLAKTFSKSNKITDSAASGTAIATGHKTKNYMIGMDADSIPLPSILEILADKGKKTGIVVTCYVTHATPAVFVAKNPNRNKNYEIALDFAKTDKLHVLMGGGKKYFNNRKDGLNLLDTMAAKGWTIYDTLTQVDVNKEKIAVLAGERHLAPYPERGDFLPDATALALKSLSNNNDKGFFLMVEGSQIDFACHNNDSVYLVNELYDFDKTINVVLDYAERNPNTLVIVTADHETGGLTMVDPEGKYTETCFRFSTGSHSPLLVPVFAYGPGAERFTGIMDNTEIMKRILEVVK